MTKDKHLKTNDWTWLSNNQGCYLTFKLLTEKGFQHGFFDKNSANNIPKDLTQSINKNFTTHNIQQVHGNIVIKASKTLGAKSYQCDGLISDKNKQSLWIYTADCIPILIANLKTGSVGACHAGWKGIKSMITIQTLKEMIRLGSKKEDLLIIFGPAITGINYQVKENVADSICRSTKPINKQISFSFKEEIEEFISNGIIELIEANNHFRIDIRKAARVQLINHGLIKEQIISSPYCTFYNKNLFNSWRRDKQRKFQWSMIMSRI